MTDSLKDKQAFYRNDLFEKDRAGFDMYEQSPIFRKMKADLEFYAQRAVWGNGCAAIDPCDTYTCELGALRGGKRAIETLRAIEGDE